MLFMINKKLSIFLNKTSKVSRFKVKLSRKVQKIHNFPPDVMILQLLENKIKIKNNENNGCKAEPVGVQVILFNISIK